MQIEQPNFNVTSNALLLSLWQSNSDPTFRAHLNATAPPPTGPSIQNNTMFFPNLSQPADMPSHATGLGRQVQHHRSTGAHSYHSVQLNAPLLPLFAVAFFVGASHATQANTSMASSSQACSQTYTTSSSTSNDRDADDEDVGAVTSKPAKNMAGNGKSGRKCAIQGKGPGGETKNLKVIMIKKKIQKTRMCSIVSF